MRTTLFRFGPLLVMAQAGCLPSGDCQVWYLDEDGDGFTAIAERSDSDLLRCTPPEGAVAEPSEVGDCDDANTDVYPGEHLDGSTSDGSASCDGVDGDCDGATDEDAPSAIWYADADADGFGDPAAAVELGACSGGGTSGLVEAAGDCDDQDAAVYPGAHEICSDGVVQDCDAASDACLLSGEVDVGDFFSWPGALAAAALGDRDGDGRADFALGEPGAGVLRLISGPAEDAEGEEIGGEGDFGASLAGGDFDGDGAMDLAVGAPGDAGGDGLVTLLSGPDLEELGQIGAGTALGLGTALCVAPGGEDAPDGLVVTTAGEFEGALLNSAWVIAAPASTSSLTGAQKVSSYGVSPDWPAALAASPDGAELAVGYTDDSDLAASVFSLPFTSGDTSVASVPVGDTAELLGASVALVDLDGAGRPDLLIGAPGAGQVRGYLNLSGTAADADLTWRDAAGGAGASVARVGDLNGDGLPELVIGGDGVAWVILGSPGGYADGALSSAALATLSGFRGFVRAITDPGDVDGDGYDDLLLTDEAGTTLLWGGPAQ